MTWQAYSVETLTGTVQDRLPVSDFRWGRALSTGTTGECTIPWDSVDFTKAQFDDLIAHWKRTIVLEFDGVVVYAGIVRDFEDVGRTTVLQLTDLWGLWARRGSWNRFAPSVNLSELTYTNLSLGTLAKRVVERGTAASQPTPVMALPLTLPADVAGPLTRTYYGYHQEFVADVLDDLAAEGVDIDFHPRWLSGALDWEMVTDPNVSTHEWDVTAAEGGVLNFRRSVSGSKMTNHAITVGQGSDVDMLIYAQADEASDLPMIERIDARKHIGLGSQLQAIADVQVVLHTPPTESWSFDVRVDGDPAVGAIRLGDTARLHFDGHPRVADGFYNKRIVKISGGLDGRMRLFCQPSGGGV